MRREMAWAGLLAAWPALAFETTDILPAGGWRASFQTTYSRLTQATGPDGSLRDLAAPLRKQVSFRSLLANQDPSERTVAEALLLTGDDAATLDSPAGYYRADLKGEERSLVPSLSYGWSERVTLQLDMPVWFGTMAADLDFKPSDRALALARSLGTSLYGTVGAGRSLAERLSTSRAVLDERMRASGYSPVADWTGFALGDATLSARTLVHDGARVRTLVVGELTVPTGRVDDPDLLTDLGFGGGQWDLGGGVVVSEMVRSGLLFNQFLRYTAQLRGRRDLRWPTDEPLVGVRRSTRFDPGDVVEAGAEARAVGENGLGAGLAYSFRHKNRDRFWAGDAAGELSADTWQRAHLLETELTWSGMPDFLGGRSSFPLETRMAYQHVWKSRNTVLRHRLLLDLGYHF